MCHFHLRPTRYRHRPRDNLPSTTCLLQVPLQVAPQAQPLAQAHSVQVQDRSAQVQDLLGLQRWVRGHSDPLLNVMVLRLRNRLLMIASILVIHVILITVVPHRRLLLHLRRS